MEAHAGSAQLAHTVTEEDERLRARHLRERLRDESQRRLRGACRQLKRQRDQAAEAEHETAETEPAPPPATAALRKLCADLLRRVCEVDPFVCSILPCAAALLAEGRIVGYRTTFAPQHPAGQRGEP